MQSSRKLLSAENAVRLETRIPRVQAVDNSAFYAVDETI
jgi:hypothetical protein